MDAIVDLQERRAARFERAVLPYLDYIYSAALLMTRDLDDADDLVQVTFAQAYESFYQVQPSTDVKAWLFRAFAGTFTDTTEWREPASQPIADKPGPLQPAEIEPPIPFGMGGMDDEALNQLPDSEIKEALQQLPANLRLTVYLANVEGYTYAEIADIVDAPIPTVTSRLHQGRRRLRALLLRHANEAAVIRRQRT
jgi:RNA polymerase sigma-70 factor (ECF subfamily)